MKTLIPHKDNPNVARKFLGIFAILSASVFLSYFGKSYVEKNVGKAQALQSEKVSIESSENNQSDLIIESTRIEEEVAAANTVAIPIVDSEKMAITIKEAKAPAPIVRNKDPKKRLEEAIIYARPSIIQGKYIDISLEHQNMVLFEDGNFVDAFLVSSGKRGMETPKGIFKIENKVPRAWSKTYSLFMPNWMAIIPSGKFGIHELPEWPGGYKEGANHLGVAVSHGCVRLGVGDSKKVYEWADVGTQVVIHE